MKKSVIFGLLLVLALSLVSSASFAQVTVYAKYSNGKVIPCVTVFGTKKINDKISFTYFALIQKKWAEAYWGVAYSPVKWVSIGLSAGIEQNPALYRLAASLWLGKGNTSFLLLIEKGDGLDNYWYKATLTYQVTNNFFIGARAWRFNGVGPSVEYKFKDLKVWLMPAYDFENKNSNLIVGVDIKI